MLNILDSVLMFFGEKKISSALTPSKMDQNPKHCQKLLYLYIFGGLECVGHSLRGTVAHFIFLKDVWIRFQRAAVASRRTTNLATHGLEALPVIYFLIFLRNKPSLSSLILIQKLN